MGDFIGRSRELAALERAYTSPGSELVPVYGRRRVGKSELLLRFVRGKPHLYYLGKKGPPGLQIKELLREAARVFRQPLLASLEGLDWKRAFVEAIRHHDLEDIYGHR